jgi:2-oxoglutarate dehydrogenase E1 component
MSDLLELAINLPFVDEMFARYQKDKASVDPSWRALFENGAAPAAWTRPAPAPQDGANGHNGALALGKALDLAVERAAGLPPLAEDFVHRVAGLVNEYRVRGHLEAELDPLGKPRDTHPELALSAWGLEEDDLSRPVPPGLLYGAEEMTLGELLARARTIYAGHLGVELMHIPDRERRGWLQQRMESTLNQPPLDRATQLYILEGLTAAEVLESFVHTKYIGTKRFSLEGGESLIPLLDLILDRAGAQGTEEVVLGMAHRGRLNVLANVLGKSAGDIFAEFEDIDPESMFGGGDVKYHLGYSTDRLTRGGQLLHLSLAFNPSHLEAVDPVVLGRVRAKQRRRKDTAREKVMGLLIHGDAAFSGQGLVYETLNLAALHGYRSGGTVHVVVNNQIGFTTLPKDSRSTPYCTDVAKGILVPIFHVNGDDPEAVAQAAFLAMDYRNRFKSDVVIDLWCYRKYGHNEADEPSFTQPRLYHRIESHPPPRQVYARSLVARGIATEAEVKAILDRHHQRLEDEFRRQRQSRPKVQAGHGYWVGFHGGRDAEVPEVDTGVPAETLGRLTARITQVPEGFHVNSKVARLLEQRAKMGRGEAPLDWGMGEQLAFATLVDEQFMVRLSGQDSGRGTFSHRHAVLVDQEDEREYVPLENLHPQQGRFRVYNSPLSEAGVLGFEFGYSLDYPDGLIIWEAQFGDFVNGAQVIIDQFVTSCEDKWKRLSGLVMLLPHGFEGQGPEHSSARIERFLEACAEDNIQVCNPTTPAQYFHLLRRQVHRKLRKPLIVMTPKSLLRLPAARSPLEDFTCGGFQRILDDPEPPRNRRRLLLCSGKLAYELFAERKKRNEDEVAIVRLEQLYPLSDEQLLAAIERHRAPEVVWVQEEPANMGAHRYVLLRLEKLVKNARVASVTRVESASPATGSHKAHEIEQAQLLERAFFPLTQ